MRLFFSAVLALYLLTTAIGYADGLEDANAGLDALNRGDNATAVRLFTQALRASGLSASDRELALVKRAQAYIGEGRDDLGLADLQQALKLDPGDQEATNLQNQARKGPAVPTAVAGGPKSMGTYGEWTAALHAEASNTVCYAFTRVQASRPALPGRGAVVLTVTERRSGRDQVAVEAGFTYGSNASVMMQVEDTGLDFYTSGRNAFARNGQAAVAAFAHGAQAVVQSPGPINGLIIDTFSLNGFSAAYAAITRACP